MADLEPAITVDNFDGLRLGVPPALVGADGALDLLDVDWDARGVLRSRPGVRQFTTKAPPQEYDRIFGHGVDFLPLGEDFAILARRGETLVWLNAAGEEGVGSIPVSTGRLSFAQIGQNVLTPQTYIANQNEPVRKFYEGAFSSPAAKVDGVGGKTMPKGHFVVDWQDGANRLVVANTTLEGAPGGAAGSPSHVFFSEPGDPESFESTAYVALNPGDGEQIVGMCTYGRNVFVFKETYCFVFYGISADEEGRPIFNFSTIELGTRVLGFFGSDSQPITVGRDGVYFLAQDGIWVTTGGAPVRVTDALKTSSDRHDPPGQLGGMAFPTWERVKGFITYLDDCVYVGFPENAGESTIKRLLKLDLETGRVTYWKVELIGTAVFALTFGGTPRLLFSGGAGHKGIFYFDPTTDADPVVAMDPYWLSGFYDLEDPDEKALTEMKVWGTGEVEIAVAEDFGEVGEGKLFELGEGEGVDSAELQRGQDATFLQHKISGAAPWSVQRVTRYLRDSRVSGTEKP
jgi:hypothetical protein